MKTFYIEDENGTYLSPSKNRRFRKLIGREAYNFLREEAERGIRHRFIKFDIELPMPMRDEGDREPEQSAEPLIENAFVEISADQIPKMRVDERRKQYVDHCVRESGLETISLNAPLHDREDLTIEDTVAQSERGVEDSVLHEIELEMLRRALKTLSDDELIIIHELYLAEKTLTERELSKKIGVPQRTINHRKQSILKKLKKFLD